MRVGKGYIRIAIARKIITFRTGEDASVETALLAAASYGGLLAVLGAMFYAVQRQESGDGADIDELV